MRGSAARALLPGLAMLGLIALVAVASTGSTPTGTPDGRKPSDVLLDTFFTLGFLALLPAAAIFVWGLLQRKEIAREIASGRYPRTTLAAWIVFVLLFTVAVYFGYRSWNVRLIGRAEVVDVGRDQGRVPPPEVGVFDPDAYQAEFAWIPVLVVVTLAAIGILAYVVASRRRGTPSESTAAAVAEQLADVVEDTLDDLRAEPDARRAVIAAYARLERALAASGLPRSRSETAQEYLARILDRLKVDASAVRRLTDLYTRAKFSQHEVDQAMKEHALEALVQIRDELRLAARRWDETVPEPTGSEQAAPS